MHLLAKTTVAAALIASLSGCIVIGGGSNGSVSYDSDWKKLQEKNSDYIATLSLSENIDVVIGELGLPSLSEAYVDGNSEVRVLYYRTQHVHSDGKTTKDETTPLVFIDGQLKGWGESALGMVR